MELSLWLPRQSTRAVPSSSSPRTQTRLLLIWLQPNGCGSVSGRATTPPEPVSFTRRPSCIVAIMTRQCLNCVLRPQHSSDLARCWTQSERDSEWTASDLAPRAESNRARRDGPGCAGNLLGVDGD